MIITKKLQENFRLRKLKKLCFNKVYFAGSEIYRLLNYEVLQNLARKIKPGDVTLISDVLFGKKVISEEEQFLYNLNKYIIFIRDNYFIGANELIAIIEMTLKSKYSEILFSKLDFNKGENHQIFYREFKKMFLDTLFQNYKFFCKDTRFHDELEILKKLSLDNENELEILFSVFKGALSYRHKGLYNFFIDLNDGVTRTEYELNFYQKQWENLMKDYFKVKNHLKIVHLS